MKMLIIELKSAGKSGAKLLMSCVTLGVTKAKRQILYECDPTGHVV
jgi:hypothetical protein